MTNEERDLIEKFIARVGGNPQSGGAFGSVPQTQAALPPLDPEADRTIRDNFARHPEAPYRITQMAVVQEAALAESQNRIKRLEWDLQQAQQQLQTVQQSQQQQAPRSGGGFFGGLFGGGAQQQQAAPPPRWGGAQQAPGGFGQQGYAQQGGGYQAGPPPAPSYPPGYQPGMFQRQGSGFLGSALTTAAGVAGGMVAGNLLMDAFSGHGGGGGFGGGEGFGGGDGETVINNNYGDAAGGAGAGAGADPFGNAGGDVDPDFNGGGGGGDADFGGSGDWGGGDNSF